MDIFGDTGAQARITCKPGALSVKGVLGNQKAQMSLKPIQYSIRPCSESKSQTSGRIVMRVSATVARACKKDFTKRGCYP